MEVNLEGQSLHPPLRSRTVELSTISAYVQCARPLEVGSVVTVKIDRGRDRNPLALEAEVVRVGTTAEGRPDGLAVRFLDIGPIEESALEELIASAGRRCPRR